MARKYSPEEAERWGWEDLVACILSPLGYILCSIGLAQVLLLERVGFIVMGAGIVCVALMYWIIDPKLKAVSDEYERRQAEFLEHVERVSRWEEMK